MFHSTNVIPAKHGNCNSGCTSLGAVCYIGCLICGFISMGTTALANQPAADFTLNRPPATQPIPDPMAALHRPLLLAINPDDQSVFEPVAPPSEEQGFNQGGVNFEFNVNYLNNNVYRGVNHNRVGHIGAPNFNIDSKLSFNLGAFPHPFAGLVANVFDSDPQSRFQEIRPFVGFDLQLRPFTFSIGHTSYIYPERESFNTAEVWAQVVLDDSLLFKTEQPVFTPYVKAAYDYQINNGWYFEAGLRHDFNFRDIGLVLSLRGDIAYITNTRTEFIFSNAKRSGFQHYDVGLVASYSLNKVFNFSSRFGEWNIYGYLWYTGKLNDRIVGDNILWGGTGIGFKY